MADRSGELRQNWVLLVSCVIGQIFGTAFITYLLSPLAHVFTSDLGWSLARIIQLTAYQAAGMTLGVPIAGLLADRLAPRPLILAAMAVLAAVVASLPIAARMGYGYFAGLHFLFGFLAAGLSGVYFTRVVGAAFDKARGFALGATLSGVGISGFIAPLYAHEVAARFDWQAVYHGFGVLMVAVAMPIVFVGLKKAAHPRGTAERPVRSPGASLAQAARDPRFYLMMVPPLALGLVISTLIVDIIPALIDRGVEAGTAARIASLYGVATVLGRLGGGWLLDRIRPARVGVGVFAVSALGTLGFQGDMTAGVVLATIAAGLVSGAEVDIMSYMTIRYFGLGHYGRIFGASYCAYMAAAMIGPFLTAGLMQRGDHALFFLCTSGVLALSALVLLALARIEGEPFDSEEAKTKSCASNAFSNVSEAP